MLGLDYIVFTIAGKSTSVIELLAAVSGLICVFFASRAKILNFWVGYIYTVLLFLMFMDKHLYSSMLLQPVSLILNIFGHYRWTHPKPGEENKKKELIITLLSNRKRILHLLMIVMGAVVWGFILTRLPQTFNPARLPYLDAFITMTILTALYLSAQKKLECWAAWLTVNVSNLILYILAGWVFMPFVAGCYLIFATMGFITWKRKYKEDLDKNNHVGN